MIGAERIAATLGGERVLRHRVRDYAALDRVVHDGLPFAALKAMVDMGRVSMSEIRAYVIPASTLTRRTRTRALSVAESERTERLARVVATAEEVFGERGKAHRWMRSGLPELGGRTPLEVSATELGARGIETLLWEIAYGLPA
jgi:putative toxin-antitoxin system antitoxin component (TIGR02293 family)